MARKLRVQQKGASYDVMNRGERREPISCDDHEYITRGAGQLLTEDD